MTVCSISEILAEGVECDRWVWFVSAAACTVVLAGCCCLVGFYWDFLCGRRCGRRTSSKSNPAPPVPSTAKGKLTGSCHDDREPPWVLQVHSPSQHVKCSGDYKLVRNMTVNGQPLWEKCGAERWLYSGVDGRWYICGPATKERNFQGASGYIYNSSPHKGTWPHHLSSSWEWSGGLQWHRDPAITITLPEIWASQVVNITPKATGKVHQLNADPRVFGAAYCSGLEEVTLIECKQVEGPPLKDYKVQSQAPRPNPRMSLERGNTMISDDSTQDNAFSQLDNCDTNTEHSAGSCSLSSPAPSVQGAGGGYAASAKSDTSSSVATTSSRRSVNKEPAKTLCVISPSGQQACAGTYELLDGEMANGQPLWKQKGGQRWLYSGTSGRWCIGGQDVKEDDFQRAAGYISQTAPHKGAMPDRTSSIWLRWDGEKFEKDSRITVVQLHTEHDREPSRPKGSKLDLRGKNASDGLKKKLRNDVVTSVMV